MIEFVTYLTTYLKSWDKTKVGIRGVVVGWHPWVFQEVEHMLSQFAQAVSHLAEWFLELVEILIEEFVQAFHPG